MGHPSNIFICLLLFNSDRGVQANLNLQRYFNFYQKHLKSLFANPVYSSSGVIFSFLSNRDQVSFLLCNSSSGPFLGAFSLATCMDIPDQLPKTQWCVKREFLPKQPGPGNHLYRYCHFSHRYHRDNYRQHCNQPSEGTVGGNCQGHQGGKMQIALLHCYPTPCHRGGATVQMSPQK